MHMKQFTHLCHFFDNLNWGTPVFRFEEQSSTF